MHEKQAMLLLSHLVLRRMGIILANVTLIKIAHTLFQVYLFVFVAQLFHQSKLDNNHPLPPLNNEKEHQ